MTDFLTITEEDVASSARKRRRRPSVSPSRAAQLQRQVERMMEAGDWSVVAAAHLVALYAWCHERVYGVPPLELTGIAYARAILMAKQMVARHFGGEPAAAVPFVNWAWTRERARLAKRALQEKDGSFRMGWQLQFGGRLLTDWLCERRRNGGR